MIRKFLRKRIKEAKYEYRMYKNELTTSQTAKIKIITTVAIYWTTEPTLKVFGLDRSKSKLDPFILLLLSLFVRFLFLFILLVLFLSVAGLVP